MSWVAQLARADIVSLQAYEYASWEPDLTRMHANELPWRAPKDESVFGLNRYPEPQPKDLVERLAQLYGAAPHSVLAARGSDEAIDLLVRAFCRAGQDSVLVCPPTFAMYTLAAAIQGARVVSVPLRAMQGFALDADAVLQMCTPEVKIVFLCSPNNPTGNLLSEEAIVRITQALTTRALVVVDEAYVEFAACQSLARYLPQLPNLAVLRTLSKAHGLAGVRCGTLIADPDVITLLKKIIHPYAIPQLTLEAVLKLLEPGQLATVRKTTALVRFERERVTKELARLPFVKRVWPSKANFILAEFADAAQALFRAHEAQLLVRDVRGYLGLASALRITIGTLEENERLLEAWA